jgi:hypothetical protein
MIRASSTNGEDMNEYSLLVGKTKRKRPLGRPVRRWVNIKVNLRYDGVVWSGLM